MNIISNAIRAIPGTGKIYIKTEVSEGGIRLKIKDTGTGISEEIREKVFEPFFTTRDIGEGKGSEFIITLPASHNE